MFKIISILCFTFLVCTINSFSQIKNNSDLLYSQIDTYQGIWSLPSYKNLSNSWTQIADDFSSNTDWIIDQIVVVGDDIDSSAIDGFNIYIYDNSNGPGTLIYSAESQPYSILFLYYFYWKCTITLDIPFQLTAGNYWISVQFQSNSGTSTGWNWSQVIDNHENTAVFRSNGTGQCASWVPVTSGICLPVSNTDMYFELWGSTTLPVELTSYSASVNEDNVKLSWITATETNNQGFEIYRNGNKIAFVEGKGTTTETQSYSFVDKNLQAGIYNYKLNQIDFDGTQKVVGELTVNLSLPEKFALEQNYPNPFNPSTKISYQLPVSSDVTLKVYDVLGNEVATLVDEEKPAGSYEVEFDASNLSSGTYFYQMRAGSFIETKKMVFIE